MTAAASRTSHGMRPKTLPEPSVVCRLERDAAHVDARSPHLREAERDAERAERDHERGDAAVADQSSR